jgi:hypothetical protein
LFDKKAKEISKLAFLQRIRREMDGDDELFKETENLLEEGQFRVMKDDNRSLHWDDTVVYNGKKIMPVNIKRERGMGDSDDEVKI